MESIQPLLHIFSWKTECYQAKNLVHKALKDCTNFLFHFGNIHPPKSGCFILCFLFYFFFHFGSSLFSDVRDVRVSVLIWHPFGAGVLKADTHSRKRKSIKTKSVFTGEPSVINLTNYQVFQPKTETSRTLSHICFLWCRRTKVMKSLTRARPGGDSRGEENEE